MSHLTKQPWTKKETHAELDKTDHIWGYHGGSVVFCSPVEAGKDAEISWTSYALPRARLIENMNINF